MLECGLGTATGDVAGSPIEEDFENETTLVASLEHDDWDSEATVYTNSESEYAASPPANDEVIHLSLCASPG